MDTHSVCQFVTASSVREDIVRLLSRQQQPTPTLIEKLDACRSGIYKELSNLEQRGALTEDTDGWQLTACGQLVSDTIERRQATEEFLGRDREYWQNHSLDRLPDQFRQRLPDIGEYEVVRGEMPAINRHVSELVFRMEESDRCDIVTPLFLHELEDAIPDDPETRLLVTRPVLDHLLDGGEGKAHDRGRELSNAQVRVIPVEFGLSRTSDSLCLVFPNQSDGEWQATLVSETTDAIRWGKELFESLWTNAEPVDGYPDDAPDATRRRGMVGTHPRTFHGVSRQLPYTDGDGRNGTD